MSPEIAQLLERTPARVRAARRALLGLRARESATVPPHTVTDYTVPFAPKRELRQRAHKGESSPPPTSSPASLIRETPAQMRALVQAFGPRAIVEDLLARELKHEGLTYAEAEALVHARYHGTWWSWPADQALTTR